MGHDQGKIINTNGDLRGHGAAVLRQVNRLDIQAGPLMAILNAPANDPEKVIHALEQSPALAARVLSVTNSAAIGVVGEINDIPRAVVHMGAARARSIAMAFALNIMANDAGLEPDISHRLWVNSLEKAHLARLVAEDINPEEAQVAYALGLIQDVGLAALWALDLQFYSSLTAENLRTAPLHKLEEEHFGVDHAVVGNHLLSHWQASPLLCEQVLNHHQGMITQADASAADLANMFAGMLSHDGESMTPDRMEWLDSVHGQFLPKDDSPDKLIKNAVGAAKEVHGGAPSVRIDDAARARIQHELDIDTAGMVRQLCAMENLLNQKHEQVHALEFEAMTDPLTQLLNRRGFNRLGGRRLHNAIQRNLPISAIAIDLDGFKQVNDTHGHDAGDLVLTEVANLLRSNIDSSDMIGRLGGDEFAVLQINVTREVVEKIVNRISNACQGKVVNLDGGVSAKISFSMGVATCDKPTSKTQLPDLLAAADEAMYASKRAGHGGVIFTEFPGQQRAG